MGRNKHGGGPKTKGRLAAALVKEQQAAAKRAEAKLIAQRQAELKKQKEGGPDAIRARKRAKRQRRMERELEKGKHRAEEEDEHSDDEEDDEGNVVEIKEVTQRPVVVKKRKGPTPFAPGERILLVGEGNFSFAHALLLEKPAIVSPHLLCATAFDSLTEAQQKYPDLLEHVRALKDAGATVLFGVDATKLDKTKEIKQHKGQWDRIVFNFPHVGQGITDQDRNVRANQTLILNFFKSAAPMLRQGSSRAPALLSKQKQKRKRDVSDDEDEELASDDDGNDDETADPTSSIVPPPPTTAGTILITLRTVSPYSLWCLPQLGTKGSMLAPSILPRPLPKTVQPNYTLLRSFGFDPAEWQGYEHRRTIGYKEGVSSGANEDLTLTAKERGERKRAEKEAQDRKDKEDRLGAELTKNGGKPLMRTYEFELQPEMSES
ncbi:hypothetical protein OIO90_005402 [Microbotryomycetes sp. JL221]|nr:hypothetical protein OIO90_005402 [Microbotryomycetes sp. JL221]